MFTLFGYDEGTTPPGIRDSGYGGYETAHIVIKAHAEAWHLYNDVYRSSQQGEQTFLNMNRGHVLADVIGLILGLISITLNCDWKQPPPGDETEESLEASLRGLEFMMGWFAHPIFLTGEYPPVYQKLSFIESLWFG